MSICWICGKRTTRRLVDIKVGNNPVKAHKICARSNGNLKAGPDIDEARRVGRDQLPLRLKSYGRTLVLCKQITGDGLVVCFETGRSATTTMRAYINKPARPEIVDGKLMFHSSWLQLALDEREPVAAWLTGFYGGEA